MNIVANANMLLANDKLGMNYPVNISKLTIEIMKLQIYNKSILCKIV